MNQTLVLNKNWAAISVTSVWRSLILMCRGAALAVCPESFMAYDMASWIERSMNSELSRENAVSTPTMLIEKPAIILVKGYGGIPHAEVNFTRKNVYKRDKYCCQYCLKKCSLVNLTIDHIHPRSKGGLNSFENCVTACQKCNSKKADRTLKQSGMKLAKKPVKPKWNPVMGMVPKIYPDCWEPFLKNKKGF